MSLDDLPLDAGRDASPPPPPARTSSVSGQAVAVTIVLVVALLGGAMWYARSRSAAPAVAGAAATPAPGAVATSGESPIVVPELPPLDQMDPYVRQLFASLATHPELVKWLATDDLVGGIATAIDKLAQGQSPARDLGPLRPTQGFATTRRDGVVTAAPSGYARYAPVVDAVAAVDPARLAAAFTTLRPRLIEAYVAQGHPEGSFDDAVRRAIDTVASTPDVPAGAALVPGVGGLVYANPSLERLPAAQKHLLRMGPDHARRVRAAARAFGAALAAQRPPTR